MQGDVMGWIIGLFTVIEGWVLETFWGRRRMELNYHILRGGHVRCGADDDGDD